MSASSRAFTESAQSAAPAPIALHNQKKIDDQADTFRKEAAAILARVPFSLMFAQTRLHKEEDGQYKIENSCPSLQNEEGKSINVSKARDDEEVNGFLVVTGPDGSQIMLHVKSNRIINLFTEDNRVDRDVLRACFEILEKSPILQPTRRPIDHSTASAAEKYDPTTGRDRLLDYMREQGRRTP